MKILVDFSGTSKIAPLSQLTNGDLRFWSVDHHLIKQISNDLHHDLIYQSDSNSSLALPCEGIQKFERAEPDLIESSWPGIRIWD